MAPENWGYAAALRQEYSRYALYVELAKWYGKTESAKDGLEHLYVASAHIVRCNDLIQSAAPVEEYEAELRIVLENFKASLEAPEDAEAREAWEISLDNLRSDLATRLVESRYLMDALDVLATWPEDTLMSATDAYNAACTKAQLMVAFENSTILVVGTSPEDKAEAEEYLNNLPEEERLANISKARDDAFHFLELALDQGFDDAEQALADRDLAPLHKDERWSKHVDAMRVAREARLKEERQKADAFNAGLIKVIHITFVEEGSVMAQAGVQANDMLLYVGETRVETIADLQAAWAPLVVGNQVTLTLRRYVIQDNSLQIKRDENGDPVPDDNGDPQWDFETFEVSVKVSTDLGIGAQNFTIPRPKDIAQPAD